MTWKRLSQRTSGSEPDGPYAGIPPHLAGPLSDWLEAFYVHSSESSKRVAILLRLPIPNGATSSDRRYVMIQAALRDEDLFLDMVDATLHIAKDRGMEQLPPRATQLKTLLAAAASTWTVTDGYDGLIEVVPAQTQEIFATATSVQDEAASELQTAWTHAFGRNGDASDAWDHAIKAIEDVLIPIVVPNIAKATLGHVVGVLGSPQSAAQWKFGLPGHDLTEDVAPFVALLRLIWPNHDRHGGGPRRTPTIDEARMVTTLAALIVQWSRQGSFLSKR